MTKHLLRTLATLLLLAMPAHAMMAPTTLEVPGYGETGWQTYSYTFTDDFVGNLLFVVSNQGSSTGNSVLLLDNLNPGFFGNTGFEGSTTKVAFAGFTPSGAVTQVSSALSYAGLTYQPTQGLSMAQLVASGVNTMPLGGTTGATLANKYLNKVVFDAGQTWSFDWAFLAHDSVPNRDFAKIILADMNGHEVLNHTLAQVTPIPGAVWLLGSGLMGLIGLRRKLC